MDRLLQSLFFPILMIVGIVISGFVLVTSLTAATVPRGTPVSIGKIAATASPALAERGRVLFVAKGCIVCHRHDAFAKLRNAVGFGLDEAPNLTTIAINADYLHRWLRDPKAIKPTTFMPNLHLMENEIDALAAFLTHAE